MVCKKKIILLAGPTASGKSKLAVHLAKNLNVDIINADSMQVYKEISVLSSRPTSNDLNIAKHHLYGFNSVREVFSTGCWLKMTTNKINQLWSKNRTAIIVGGTGQYFKALTDGLVKIPNIPINLRKKIRELHKKIGQKNFFNQLIKLDPLMMNKINHADVQRSIRAYEVKSYTRKSLTDWFKNTKSKFTEDDFFKIYIDFPRPELVDSISKRTEHMLKEGAIAEVKKLLKLKVRKNNSSNKIIGIKEIRDFLEKKSDLNEVKEKISIKTRQYAKRQSTWARGQMTNWHKVYPKDLNKLLKKISFGHSKT